MWIDGIASAGLLSILAASAGGLAPLREPSTERPSRTVSVPCPEAAKEPVMDRLSETLPSTYPEAEVVTEYGVRLRFDGGSWALVRPSGTEPYVRLYAESERVEELVDGVRSEIEAAVDAATA